MWIVDRPTRSFVEIMGLQSIAEATAVTVGPKRMAPRDSGNTRRRILPHIQRYYFEIINAFRCLTWIANP
uniref:Uncharacterized protein n=1 Tax=uncultured marine microorganism HF4000_010I05 TaxID=455517 RepID=B3T1L9_9ZZZZ|nr:hypothetical protein ALOHA_HF4000010I05ctg1g43 [uncultured marine microorganism HF4000_010I05]